MQSSISHLNENFSFSLLLQRIINIFSYFSMLARTVFYVKLSGECFRYYQLNACNRTTQIRSNFQKVRAFSKRNMYNSVACIFSSTNYRFCILNFVTTSFLDEEKFESLHCAASCMCSAGPQRVALHCTRGNGFWYKFSIIRYNLN
jgi:hypothetical protein